MRALWLSRGIERAQAFFGFWIARLELECSFEVRNSFCGSSCGGKSKTERPLGSGEVWIEANGILEFIDSLIQSALPAKGDAEIEVGQGIIGFCFKRFFKLLDGFIEPTDPTQSGAEAAIALCKVRFQADGFPK